MSMLQKERWIFDPKRGLPRDTRDVQQSDRDLRDYLVGKHKVVEIDNDPVAPAATKQTRRKKNKPPALPPIDIDDGDEVPPVVEDKPAREKRKRNVADNKKKPATKEAVHYDVFNNTFEIDSDTDTGSKKRVPPRPPGRKTQEPQVPLVTPDDINSMLDAKLANMFDMIAKNQSQLEKSFSKALEDQRKEFESTLAKQRASSVGNTDGLNSINRVNFSPVSIPGNVFLIYI
jgi:hypothetical protein